MAEEAVSADAGESSGEASEVTSTPGEVVESSSSPQWIEAVKDSDTRAWAESKGLQNGNFENVLGSYHNLEKLVGADKAGRTVTLLQDDATPDQVNTFYSKLGRPEAPEGYNFKAPEGDPGDFAKWAGETFHEAGLTEKQAKFIREKWEGYAEGIKQGQSDELAVSAADAEAALRREWGAAFDVKMAGIDVAASKLGFTDVQLQALRTAMGPVDALKWVDSLNTSMGDHSFEEGNSVQPNHRTPSQAKQELGELTMNKEFMDAWLNKQHPGHDAAMEKKAALSRLVSGSV